MQDPSVPETQYFSPSTGEPLRWYATLPNGRIDMFTLPGFHPTYGMKLLPATTEAVAAYEKQKAEAERQRQGELRKQQERQEQEAERRAKEEAARQAREEQDARRKASAEAIRKQKDERDRQAREEALLQQALQRGRYLVPDPRPS